MVQSVAKTVQQYLEELPDEKRIVIEEVRQKILDVLPEGFEEDMNFGMICYQVPLSRYPDTYNKQPLMYAALAAQKHHFAIYLMNMYMCPELEVELMDEFRKRGLKPNVGKSCIRFKKIENIPLEKICEIIGKMTVEEFIRHYENSRKSSKK